MGADTAEVARRFHNRFDDLKAALPYCHETAFFDNTNGFRKVASYSYGDMAVTKDGHRCPWLQEWLTLSTIMIGSKEDAVKI